MGKLDLSPMAGALNPEESAGGGAQEATNPDVDHMSAPRKNQAAFRRAVLQASDGCCASCGLDVKTLMFEVAELWGDVKDGTQGASVYLETLAVYGVDRPVLADPPSLWEADHIVPLHLGGTDDPHTNGQFLCLLCHRAKTTRENIRRYCDHSAFSGNACAFCGKDAHAALVSA